MGAALTTMQPLLALVVTFGLMYVLLIRPQQRRMRQHQAVVASLRAGDEIVTAGGIYGTVIAVDDETMIVEVAPGVELRVLRAAVSQRLTTEDEDDEFDQFDEVSEIDEIDVVDAPPSTDPVIETTVEGELSPGEENGRTGRAEPTRKREEEA